MTKKVCTAVFIAVAMAAALFAYRMKINSELTNTKRMAPSIQTVEQKEQPLRELIKGALQKPKPKKVCDENCPGCDKCPVRFKIENDENLESELNSKNEQLNKPELERALDDLMFTIMKDKK